MDFVVVYLRLYASCVVSAFAAIAKNGWTLLLPMGLAVAFSFLRLLLGPLGMVGGMLMALVNAAAWSAYLYFTGEVVSKSKVSLTDLKRSLGAYFWSLVNLFFVLWVVDLLLGPALSHNPNGRALSTVVTLMELVVLNAAPEVIYQKRTSGGLETITRSFKFLQESWIEWFVPNGLFLVGVFFFIDRWYLTLMSSPLGVVGTMLAVGALFHLAMVFRGFLFEVLDGTSHRQRMFRFRHGS